MKATRIKEVASQNSIERRTVRAVVQVMVVDSHATEEGSGKFLVHSSSGNTYEVDLGAGTCSCPDFSKREDTLRQSGGCKHQRRVRMAVGIDDVPIELRDRVDPSLRATRNKFVRRSDEDEDAEEAETVEEAARKVVMTDGGQDERHAEGCDDERCAGLATDEKRPELSFACWEQWASRGDHDWSDEIEREPVPASRGEPADIVLERALVEEQQRKEQERAEADREARTTLIENDRRLGVVPRGV